MVGAFQSQTHVKTREDVLEQMTWRSEGTVSTGSQLRERGCKSCPVQSCRGKGISPVSTFFAAGSSAATLPQEGSKPGPRAGKQARKVPAAVGCRRGGLQEGNTLLCWGLQYPHAKPAERPCDRSQHSSQLHAQTSASLVAPSMGNDGASLLPAMPNNTISASFGSPLSQAVHGTLFVCSWALPIWGAESQGGCGDSPACYESRQCVQQAGDKLAQDRGQEHKLPGLCVMAV